MAIYIRIRIRQLMAKLPYIPQDMQAIIDFIRNTPKPITISYFQRRRDHPISFVTITILVMIMALGIVLLYYIRTKKTAGTNITITMPSMKELEALQAKAVPAHVHTPLYEQSQEEQRIHSENIRHITKDYS
jgi:hypothetical protein